MISEESVLNNLNVSARKYSIRFFETVASTNTLLREMAEKGEKSGTVIIAENQTTGKGRMGRSFYSPSETGIYISVLLRPELSAEKVVFITTHAAVSICRAIEKTTESKPYIKWVNDIFIDGKKVCGILTETAFEKDRIVYAVMGIGINVFPPVNGFPDEIRDSAGAVCRETESGLREKIAAEFLNEFSSADDFAASAGEYRKRNLVIGKKAEIINLATGNSYTAFIDDIDKNCNLVIRDENGGAKNLSSGEIKIKI